MDYHYIFVWCLIGLNFTMCGWYAWKIVSHRNLLVKAQYITKRLPVLLETMRSIETGLSEVSRRIGDQDTMKMHWARAELLKELIMLLDSAYAIADSAPVAPKPPEPSQDDNRTSSLH